ncbi:potassium channel subfamily K member 18 [Hemiscyllium ocellatum]|uniref:potassium channel subfamily K member 18 n=1 Tax=Hemiscyllium ocellatum TaxID=170820 RepID=UPI002967617F|nr:potassium channel subfamily K member 18 [Hemiscyllium ocellatum]
MRLKDRDTAATDISLTLPTANKMSAPEQNPAAKCKFWSLKILHAIIPHLFLVFLLVMYAVFGAFLFEQLESTNKSAENYDIFLNELWEIANQTHDKGGIETTSGKQYFKKNIRKKLMDFQSYWSSLNENKNQWNFLGSLFFCCTVFTTVGYGHIYPLTVGGKIACMFYATFGIPIMLLVITDVGDKLAALLSKVYNHVRKRLKKNTSPPPSEPPSRLSSFKQSFSKSEAKSATRSISMKGGSHVIITPMSIKSVLNSQSSVKKKSELLRKTEIFEKLIVQENFNQKTFELCKRSRSKSCPQLDLKPVEGDSFFPCLGQELEKFDVPILIIIGVIIAYILFGAGILSIWEKWKYLDSFYFYFITITTIGFGDFVPEHPNFFMIMSILIITGMAIMSMAFKLTQNRIALCYHEVSIWINGGKKNKFKVI